jgi:hypothetical protein
MKEDSAVMAVMCALKVLSNILLLSQHVAYYLALTADTRHA